MALAFGPSDAELSKVEEDLGYKFKDKWLLKQAFIHPSVGDFNNNRFAWISDAIMHLTVSHMILDIATPGTSDTGVLEDRRKVMVMRTFCAEACKKLGWGKLAVVGKGFANATDPTTNMVAEVFEAVWGALFIDSGNDYAQVMRSYKKNLPVQHMISIFDDIEDAKKKEAEARALEKAQAKKQKQQAHLALAMDTISVRSDAGSDASSVKKSTADIVATAMATLADLLPALATNK